MVLGIYAAGGLGREVLETALLMNKSKGKWSDIFFVDDNSSITEVRGRRVITFEAFQQAFSPDQAELVIAVGEPYIRKIIREKISAAGYTLATIVHPDAYLAADANLGDGVLLCYSAMVSSGAVIGENVYLQPGCVIGHDVTIGCDSVISTFVAISGSCQVAEQCYIGVSASIKEQIRIGAGAIVSMGAVVLRDVEEECVVMGNPARSIRKNDKHRVFS